MDGVVWFFYKKVLSSYPHFIFFGLIIVHTHLFNHRHVTSLYIHTHHSVIYAYDLKSLNAQQYSVEDHWPYHKRGMRHSGGSVRDNSELVHIPRPQGLH